MGENSAIAWCTHTQNFWEGCQKVSPGCDHCYAEARDVRFTGGTLWGPHAQRRRTSAQNWRKPYHWARQVKEGGRRERPRVFCSSLSDFFDNAVPAEWRAEAWEVIRGTPQLDWLLLTKRPQNIAKMLPADWRSGYANVWLGTTVESQKEAERRVPVLLDVPATLHFLSCEPLLEAIDLRNIQISSEPKVGVTVTLDALTGFHDAHVEAAVHPGQDMREVVALLPKLPPQRHAVSWIIVGGESGKDARTYYPAWPRDLLRQCQETGAAFFHKQVGSRHEGWEGITRKGDDPAEWPADLRQQAFPKPAFKVEAA